MAGGDRNLRQPLDVQSLAQAARRCGAHDAVLRHRDLSIVIPERDFDKVRGATIDWLDDPLGTSGLRVDNPNTPSPAMRVRLPAT